MFHLVTTLFFFNDTATTEIYTLSLHDALPICAWADGDTLHIEAKGPQVHVMGFEIYVLAIVNELYFRRFDAEAALAEGRRRLAGKIERQKYRDRKSTRLNSSHT